MTDFKSKYSTCIGPSMYPTLRPGDGIELYTYREISEICVGDIIIYPHPERPTDVVHRIIELKDDGVITRGDNNNKIDPYTVGYGDIRGKVVAAKRKNRLIPMQGGAEGIRTHKLMLARQYAFRYVLKPMRFITGKIDESKLLNIFHPLLKMKVVRIRRHGQAQSILMVGDKVVGKQSADSEEWQIRFPYKFFIRRKRLLGISRPGGNT